MFVRGEIHLLGNHHAKILGRNGLDALRRLQPGNLKPQLFILLLQANRRLLCLYELIAAACSHTAAGSECHAHDRQQTYQQETTRTQMRIEAAVRTHLEGAA